jgi:hypothetical protein
VRSIRLQTTDTVPNVSEITKHKGECLLNIAHLIVLVKEFMHHQSNTWILRSLRSLRMTLHLGEPLRHKRSFGLANLPMSSTIRTI